jgi:hypothetical protein
VLGIVFNMVSDWIPLVVIPLSLAALQDEKYGIGIRSTRLGDAVGDDDGCDDGDDDSSPVGYGQLVA